LFVTEKWADLHLHTVYSDGSSTPAEVVASARALDLSALSIVDHDTIKGIPPSLAECRAAGIEFIPGIELSSNDSGGTVHLLGYGIDWQDKSFGEFLEGMEKSRVERMKQMFQKLAGLGVALDLCEFLEAGSQGTVGRLQLAHFLVKKGVVASLNEAFERYIGDGKPAYLPVDMLKPREAVEMILRVRGVPVLAHPGITRRDELIPHLVSWGLRGIEVYYSKHPPEAIHYYGNLAEKHGLLVLGGSDCHGAGKGGSLIGTVRLPYEYVEKLKAVMEERVSDGHR